MPFQLPAAMPYVVGVLLLIFGALRFYHLGWRRKAELGEAEDEAASAQLQSQMKEAKRHMRFGAIWIVMGLILLLSNVVLRAVRS